jgi:hypothetical protein
MIPTAPTRGEKSKKSASRAGANGVRNRNLHEMCFRNQVSIQNVVHKMRFHEQLRWGHHGGGTKVHLGPAKPDSVYTPPS